MDDDDKPPFVADVAAASAAMTFNSLPDLMRLSETERFERLRLGYESALMAYVHFSGVGVSTEPRRVPVPSAN